MSYYEQYVLFEAWASILLFNRKQEALSVPVWWISELLINLGNIRFVCEISEHLD